MVRSNTSISQVRRKITVYCDVFFQLLLKMYMYYTLLQMRAFPEREVFIYPVALIRQKDKKKDFFTMQFSYVLGYIQMLKAVYAFDSGGTVTSSAG